MFSVIFRFIRGFDVLEIIFFEKTFSRKKVNPTLECTLIPRENTFYFKTRPKIIKNTARLKFGTREILGIVDPVTPPRFTSKILYCSHTKTDIKKHQLHSLKKNPAFYSPLFTMMN